MGPLRKYYTETLSFWEANIWTN